MRITILVALLLCVINPRTSKNVTKEQTETNTQNSQTSLCLPPPLIANISAYENQDQCQKETPTKKPTLIEITPSPLSIKAEKSPWEIALFFATVCLVLVGVFQIKFLRKTVIATEKNAEAARESAAASRANTQAIIDTERAWMDIDLGVPEKDPDTDEKTDSSRYSIQIINRGRTVAHVETIQYGVNAASGAWDSEGFNNVNVKFAASLGNSDKPTVVITINIPNQFLDWDSIRDGKKVGYIRLAVIYRDVVKASDSRQSSAIFKWDVQTESPERQAIFNTYR